MFKQLFVVGCNGQVGRNLKSLQILLGASRFIDLDDPRTFRSSVEKTSLEFFNKLAIRWTCLCKAITDRAADVTG